MNLICRLYDVDDGSVCVGGVDVRKYDTEVLRNQVSVVLQKNTLFSGTILDNLRWGNPDATEEECIEACKAACADEFIDRMPEGISYQYCPGRRQCFRRSEAASVYRQSPSEETEGPDPGRLHQRGRYGNGRQYPGGFLPKRSRELPRSSLPSVFPVYSPQTGSLYWTTDGSMLLTPMTIC